MSMTSCTSAAAAAAASSTLTRNSTASLYASISALHSDDGDARSGEEMGADDDDPQTMTSGTKGRRQEQCLLADVHQQIDRDKVSMNEKGPLHCQRQSGSGAGHVVTAENDSRTVNSKSSSLTRRNKRKNFQPRNIRQSGSPDDDDDGDDDDENDETDGDEDEEVNYDLLEGEDEENLSISNSRANQKEPSPFVVLTPQNSSTSSTRKRRKSSNSSSSSSANILLHSQYPLDLREGPVLRHGRISAFSQGRKDRHPEEEESNEERTSGRESDDDDDESLRSDLVNGAASAPMGAVDLSRANRRERSKDSDMERRGIRRPGALNSSQVDREESSSLKMRTWMMLWQQQQQQQQPASHLSQEQLEHLELLGSSSHQQSSEPSNNDNFMMGGRMDPALVTKYAETTMRQLLSLYGLPQEAAAQLIAQQLPLGSSFLTPYAAAAAAAATAALTSTRSGSPPSRPSASSSTHTLSSGSGSGHQQPHQPPTPPHTPKTGNGSGASTMAVAGPTTHEGQTHAVPSISSYSSSASLTDRIPSSAGSCGDRVAGTAIAGTAMAEPEASLHALQAHMQSVLKATRSSQGKSPTTSASNTIPTSETMRIPSKSDRQVPSEEGGLISTTMAPFIGLDFHLEARSLDQAAEQQQHHSSKKYTSNSPNSVPIISSGSKSSKIGGGSGSRGTSGSGNGSSTGSSSKANSAPIDYSRYVKRFGSALECGSPYCKDLNYREHFHCLDCHPRVFVKKEEMIRHFKWHKKRDESLANGFMRYSPGDDCNDRYRGCPHNRKQTHYHCVMKSTCDKVYISTSDVQMHANYHRKDSAIMQEGFQRFRATEDCATDYCAFNGQRTTHFHCIRPPCNYTFKNKADMEKHKSYHIKDEQLARDGFKKFMKNEECQFDGCRFSRVCNHIHCVREHCNYVLHSSGQLYSHKRKHERRDAELASQGANAINHTSASHDSNSNSSSSSSNPTSSMLSVTEEQGTHQKQPSHGLMGFAASDLSRLMSDPSLAALLYGRMPSMLSQLEAATLQHQRQQQIEMQERVSAASLQLQQHQQQTRMLRSPSPVMSEEDAFRLCLARVEAGKVCHEPNCQSHPHEHYHCRSDGCNLSFRSTEAAKEHWRNHEQQEHITDNYYISVDVDEEPNPCPTSCPFQTQQRHYHCCWENCKEIVLASEKPFRRLDHYKMHEYSRKAFANRCATPPLLSTPPQFPRPSTPLSIQNPGMTTSCITVGREAHSSVSINNTPSSAFSLDSMFRRKRGRPPKNRVIEVWNESSVLNHGSGQQDTPQAIFTSFKLPKPTTPPLSHTHPSSNTTSSSLFLPQHSISALAQYHRTSSPSPTQGVSSLSHPVASPASSRSNKNQRISTSPSPERFHEGSGSKQLTGRNRASSADKNISPILHHHHQQKGKMSPSGQNHPPPALPPSALRSPESPNKSSSITVVKAAGTFYPLSAFPSNKSSEEQVLLPPPPNSSSSSSSSSHRDLSSPLPTSSVATAVVQQVSSSFSASLSSSSPSSTSSPTTAIAAVAPAASNTAATAAALISEKPVSYGPEQSCGRPFCKLKRREHYHCVICNQAFSEVERLKPHMLKHCSGALSPSMSQWASSSTFSHSLRIGSDIKLEHTTTQEDSKVDVEQSNLFGNTSAGPSAAFLSNQEKDVTARSSAALQALSFMPYGLIPPLQPSSGNGPSFLPPGFQSIYSNTNLLLANTMASFGRPGSPVSGLKRPSPSPIDHLMMNSPDSKKMRFQSSMRILKDEPVPDGYVRFRFNEDCQYGHCGYREHQTHFHCMRTDCGYSFCDKTRFVQHTARHERLDTLMGGDFQQYRANVGCGRPGCIYTASLGAVQNKASHFHCLKCDFVCTDTNKVVAHRRQHQKTNSIMAAGFEKFTPSQSCRIESCPHSNKQTHYHCLKCSYAVLGLAQMSAHKYRHLESSSPSATTTSA